MPTSQQILEKTNKNARTGTILLSGSQYPVGPWSYSLFMVGLPFFNNQTRISWNEMISRSSILVFLKLVSRIPLIIVDLKELILEVASTDNQGKKMDF